MCTALGQVEQVFDHDIAVKAHSSWYSCSSCWEKGETLIWLTIFWIMAVFLSLKVLDTSSLQNPAVCTYTTICSTLLPYLDIEHAEAELHFRPCREFANGTVYPTTATHAEWLVCTYISEKRRKLSEGDHIRRDLNRSHNERSRIICSLMCVRETCHSKFVIFRQPLHITDRLQYWACGSLNTDRSNYARLSDFSGGPCSTRFRHYAILMLGYTVQCVPCGTIVW